MAFVACVFPLPVSPEIEMCGLLERLLGVLRIEPTLALLPRFGCAITEKDMGSRCLCGHRLGWSPLLQRDLTWAGVPQDFDRHRDGELVRETAELCP